MKWNIYLFVAILLATLMSLIASLPLDCSMNPCQNGGTCEESTDGAVCSCRPRFSGTMCQDKDFSSCPPLIDFSKFSNKEKLCLNFVQPWTYIDNAKKICNDAGGTLVAMNTQAKYQMVSEWAEEFSGTGFWVDVRKVHNRWQWPDGTVINDSMIVNRNAAGTLTKECLIFAGGISKFYLFECDQRKFLALCEAPLV